MGTFAHYYLWAGFLVDDLEEDPSEEFESFLGELRKSYPGIEREGHLFSSISMHGENIGYGVVLKDVDWVARGDRPGSPDVEMLGRLFELLQSVRSALMAIGLPSEITCKIYEHLDLGG